MSVLTGRKTGRGASADSGPALTRPAARRYLNIFMACCLAVWYAYPKFGENTVAGLFLFLLWTLSLTLARSHPTGSRERLTRYLALLVWLAFIAVMIALSTDNWFFGECKGIFLSIGCLEIYGYYFNRKDRAAIKVICVVTILAYIYTLVRSMIIGGDNFTVYRSLDHFEDVGNFATYYTAVFMIPTGLYVLVDRRFPVLARAAGLLLVFLSVMITLRAQFTIALIMVVLLTFVIWPFVRLSRMGRLFVAVAVFTVFLSCYAFGRPLISGMLLDLGRSLGVKTALGMRITEIGYFIKGGNPEKSFDLLARLGLYWASVVNFFRFPLFGGRFAIALGLTDQTSGHNSLMYTFEAYGLIPAVSFFIYCRHALAGVFRYCRETGGSFYRLVIAVAAAYLILSCVNPTFQLYPMTWVIAFGVLSVNLLKRGNETERSV